MKKFFYRLLFLLLGVLLQLLAHAVIEYWFIQLLVSDFETYGLGFSWEAWFTIHTYYTVVLIVLGLWFGWSQGNKWWDVLYKADGTLRKQFMRPFSRR